MKRVSKESARTCLESTWLLNTAADATHNSLKRYFSLLVLRLLLRLDSFGTLGRHFGGLQVKSRCVPTRLLCVDFQRAGASEV